MFVLLSNRSSNGNFQKEEPELCCNPRSAGSSVSVSRWSLGDFARAVQWVVVDQRGGGGGVGGGIPYKINGGDPKQILKGIPKR